VVHALFTQALTSKVGSEKSASETDIVSPPRAPLRRSAPRATKQICLEQAWPWKIRNFSTFSNCSRHSLVTHSLPLPLYSEATPSSSNVPGTLDSAVRRVPPPPPFLPRQIG